MTDPIERAARAIASIKEPPLTVHHGQLSVADIQLAAHDTRMRYARAAILAFLDGQEDDVAEAIQDAADIDANSMTYARSVLRALRAAAGGEG